MATGNGDSVPATLDERHPAYWLEGRRLRISQIQLGLA